jgi:predicted aspartyl protease
MSKSRRILLRVGWSVLLIANAVAQTPAKRNAEPKLDSLVEQREYPELERVLPNATLDETSRAYFEGVMANRRDELQQSIALLQPVIPKLSDQSKRAGVALRTLADDYVKTFRYADADRVYTELLSRYKKQFNAADRQTLEDDAATDHLLIDAPPQSVEMKGEFSLSTHPSKIGTIDADLTVSGVTRSWILDTGANFSVVTESLAKQMGLKLSEGTAQTQGASGAENRLHIAIIPQIKIETATVHNVVALVLPDKSLNVNFGKGSYQIDAILGYPVLTALGQLTFSADHRVLVAPGGNSSGSRIYMQQLNPLIDCRISGLDLLMMFDTGASSTVLTAKYYRAFIGQFANLHSQPHGVVGAGGIKKLNAYRLPQVSIGLGGQTAVLKDVTVEAEPLGTDFDYLYGTIGRDLTNQFKSFTLDFKSMRFRLER